MRFNHKVTYSNVSHSVWQAFQAAWAAACKVESSTIIIPSKYEFLVGPISFSGPYCQHNIVFQVDNDTLLMEISH